MEGGEEDEDESELDETSAEIEIIGPEKVEEAGGVDVEQDVDNRKDGKENSFSFNAIVLAIYNLLAELRHL